MSARHLLQFFDARRAAGESLVLATVFATLGSTYSKAGHRILIGANGDYRGLVSGGCLEGDLAERARQVVASERPAVVTYDLRDATDELFGLGVGCNGLLKIFLQPLLFARGHQPFASIAACLRGTEPASLAIVIDSDDAALPVGTTVIVRGSASEICGAAASAAEELVAGAELAVTAGGPRLVAAAGRSVLYAPLRPIPRLLVLGAGLDAVPLVGMAVELGWRVTLADHRPAYLERVGFERAEQQVLVEPGRLASVIALHEFDAVIVMSHHLPTDRKYLAELATVNSPYLGVLGPRARRDRLLGELGAAAEPLRARLKGPVGLDIGADSPESIALSILAELQTTLGRR